MGHLSRKPDGNDPPRGEWAYGPREPHDDFSALLNGLARRCAACRRVTMLRYLSEGACPECREAPAGAK
jgi:hypothetical protein